MLVTQTQERYSFGLFAAGAIVLAVAGAAYPPYSIAAAIAIPFAAYLLIARPVIAFALFIAVESLISEDVLLVTEKLKQTLYYIPLPYIGINIFEVALILLLAATLIHRRGRYSGTQLDLAMGLFAASCVLGYLTCIYLYGDPGRVFEPRRLLHFFAAYFLTVNLIRDKESLKIFLVIFFFAIALKGLQGVYLYIQGEGLLIKWRIRALFTGWADSLNFMTYLIILSVFLLDRAPLPFKRTLVLLAPAVFFSFMFSYKRAYYVAIVVGILVMGLLQRGRARMRFVALAMLAIVALAALTMAMGQWQAMAMRVESILNPTQESSANYRLIEWKNAMISIYRNPVVGIGLGGVMPMEIYLSRTNLLGVHNTFLWVAVKMGAIGLFTYLFLLFCFWRRLWMQNTRLRDPFLRSLSRGLTCVFIAFCAAQIFAPMFVQMRTSAWFGVILGIGMMLAELDRGDERKYAPSSRRNSVREDRANA